MRYSLATAAIFALAGASAQADTAPVDPQIAAIVTRISPDRLKADDAHLVAFGTRSTFSENLGDKRGVFAARAWIADQFREIAKASGGRMTVAFDSYVQKADGKRIPRDVEISSVIATLKGDEPGGRTYVFRAITIRAIPTMPTGPWMPPGRTIMGRARRRSLRPPVPWPRFRSMRR
jgi:hypothetical protein